MSPHQDTSDYEHGGEDDASIVRWDPSVACGCLDMGTTHFVRYENPPRQKWDDRKLGFSRTKALLAGLKEEYA